jgi:hypothetical protein
MKSCRQNICMESISPMLVMTAIEEVSAMSARH